jgi:hypothetical protein
MAALFCIKILFGVALWWIYTYYYTDRSTADIYKYFDDSKVMYDALWKHPSDYVRMLFAIGNDNPYFDRVYYSHMNYWYREFESNIYNDSHTIIRFNAFIRLFSCGHYFVHALVISFLSFAGLTGIYKTFVGYLRDKKNLLVFAVFLLPSVLLWSSGVLKEGFLFFGMGMLLYHFHCIITENFKLKNLLWIIFAIVILLFTKFYVFACLAPGLLAWAWSARNSGKTVVFKFFVTGISVLLIALNIHLLLPSYNVLQVLARRQSDFIALAKGGIYLTGKGNDTLYIRPADKEKVDWIKTNSECRIQPGTQVYTWKRRMLVDSFLISPSDTEKFFLFKQYEPAGSRIAIDPLQPTVKSFLESSPAAFINTLVRPLPGESKKPMILFPMLENIFVLFLCIFCLFFFRLNRSNIAAFLFCIFFVAALYTLTGLTTPVTGAIVRYRVPALPFLLIAFLLLADGYKMKTALPFLKKIL